MANERWNSPFSHTIAFVLFKEHFTELNNIYWAHVPAASTIEKKALEALKSKDADPKLYFLIPDKDVTNTKDYPWYRHGNQCGHINCLFQW